MTLIANNSRRNQALNNWYSSWILFALRTFQMGSYFSAINANFLPPSWFSPLQARYNYRRFFSPRFSQVVRRFQLGRTAQPNADTADSAQSSWRHRHEELRHLSAGRRRSTSWWLDRMGRRVLNPLRVHCRVFYFVVLKSRNTYLSSTIYSFRDYDFYIFRRRVLRLFFYTFGEGEVRF